MTTPRTDESRPPPQEPTTAELPLSDKFNDTAFTSSQQVAWWPVHEHVSPTLVQVASWPTVGTPAWCALGDLDPHKLAALYDAAQHWALRLEMCQRAYADAGTEISQAADWSAIAVHLHNVRTFYADRPWLLRVVS